MLGIANVEVYLQVVVGGFKHVLFSPLVGMMIQSYFHIFQYGYCTTTQSSSPGRNR